MPTALITGITGQDGSYLAELLLAKNYRVAGTTAEQNTDQDRIQQIRDKLQIIESDLMDQGEMEDLLRTCRPQEVYNLAARASSRELWAEPTLAGELNALGVTRILEAIRTIDPAIRFVQASSSEVFGRTAEAPQRETTSLRPRNPYGVAKAYAHWMTALYREHYGLFACSSILYNHESPRRGLEFVSRKITYAAAEIKLGLAKQLRLGNLEGRRDWGFAGDYVRAMWLMLQQPVSDDYVVATGETHSVREFCDIAFACVGLDYRDYVVVDPEDARPTEATQLVGDAARAQRVLGWKPSVSFEDLVRMMVESDLKALQREKHQSPNEARGI